VLHALDDHWAFPSSKWMTLRIPSWASIKLEAAVDLVKRQVVRQEGVDVHWNEALAHRPASPALGMPSPPRASR